MGTTARVGDVIRRQLAPTGGGAGGAGGAEAARTDGEEDSRESAEEMGVQADLSGA